MRAERRTCDADDELLARDPRAHAEQDLVARVEVVERAPERDHGQQRRDGGVLWGRGRRGRVQRVVVRLQDDDLRAALLHTGGQRRDDRGVRRDCSRRSERRECRPV